MAARYSTASIIRALEVNRGLIEVAAAALGCDPGTIRRRMKSNPEVVRAIEESRAALVDLAEQRLAEAVDRGEPWAVSLVLKGLGKSRGHGDSVALTGANGGPMALVHQEYEGATERIQQRLAAIHERLAANFAQNDTLDTTAYGGRNGSVG